MFVFLKVSLDAEDNAEAYNLLQGFGFYEVPGPIESVTAIAYGENENDAVVSLLRNYNEKYKKQQAINNTVIRASRKQFLVRKTKTRIEARKPTVGKPNIGSAIVFTKNGIPITSD